MSYRLSRRKMMQVGGATALFNFARQIVVTRITDDTTREDVLSVPKRFRDDVFLGT